MVLTVWWGGPVADSGTPPRPRPATGALRGERGSQAVEFAMVLPAVVVLLHVVLVAGLVGMEVVQAQGVAREAARAAAVGSDAEAVEAARASVGGRPVRVSLDPPESRRAAGGMVEADVGLPSSVLARLGLDLELPARAVMPVESP